MPTFILITKQYNKDEKQKLEIKKKKKMKITSNISHLQQVFKQKFFIKSLAKGIKLKVYQARIQFINYYFIDEKE